MPSPAQSVAVGVEDFSYAVMTAGTDIAGGAATYGTVYTIPGLKTANYNGASGLSRLFADDGIFETADYVGEQSISIDLADILEADQARMFGFGLANGVLEKSQASTSPYLWVGFKVTLNSGASKYVSIPKVKFSKPNSDNQTKEAQVTFQTQMIEGGINNLICNGNYMLTARTDDTDLPAATLSGWFTTPVIAKTADLSALTVAITAGSGATKTMLATFSKASASASYPFVIPTASIDAIASALQVLKVADGTTAGPISAALLSAGTGLANSTVTVTITTNVSNTAVYNAIAANSAVRDASGVAVSAYLSGSVTTRT